MLQRGGQFFNVANSPVIDQIAATVAAVPKAYPRLSGAVLISRPMQSTNEYFFRIVTDGYHPALDWILIAGCYIRYSVEKEACLTARSM